MKSIKTVIAAMVGTIASALTSSAQTNLPIQSVAALRAYAIEQIANVSAYIWSQSQVYNNNTTSSFWSVYGPNPNGTDLSEVYGLVSSHPLNMEVSGTNDWCYTQTGFYNQDGDNLFYGSRSFKTAIPVCPIGYTCVSQNPFDITMNMSQTIPIYMINVNYVRILERDENGNIVRDYSARLGGEKGDARVRKVYFPAYFAGKKGEVIVQYWDGQTSSSKVFGLSTGLEQPTTPVAGTITAKIKDVLAFKNQDVTIRIPSNPQGINPTIQVVFTTNQVAAFSAFVVNGTNTVESPKGFWIRKAKQDTWEYEPLMTNNGPLAQPIDFSWDAGVYYIIVDWQNFGKNSPQEFYVPYDYSGGGKE